MPYDVDQLRETFYSGYTKPISWRRKQLEGILHLLDENKNELSDCLWKDLHKNHVEAEMMEWVQVRNEVIIMLENLDEHSSDTKCKKSILSMLNTVKVKKEPYGVVLIIGAWNYPLLLTLQPVIGAIAAGNCVIVKPPEMSAQTSSALDKLIPKYLDEKAISVFVGGPKESNDLITRNRFDLILYTGGTHVGKIVMQAAAKHLTPVILELGGKNPCYVDRSCDVNTAARRIAWGKWTNAGQICVSPDFILCEEEMKAPLISALVGCISEYYGGNPKMSASFGRIINRKHLSRLRSLLEGVEIVHGGIIDEEENYFSPTIVTNVKDDAPIRTEEVFGPILPIYTVENLAHAIELMNNGEKSLQLSIFANNRAVIDQIINQTSSGGVTVNDLLMQVNELDLPLGGVGYSGMGCYHGAYSYDSFCHHRGYYESRMPEIALKARYPPYSDAKLSMLKAVGLKSPKVFKISKHFYKMMFIALFGILIGCLLNAERV